MKRDPSWWRSAGPETTRRTSEGQKNQGMMNIEKEVLGIKETKT